MPRFFLGLVLVAAGLGTAAQEVLTAGPRTFPGSPAMTPWRASLYRHAVLVSAGDEVLMVWVGHRHNTGGSLYAARLDRQGRPLTKLPTLLVPGGRRSGIETNGGSLHVVPIDGLYAIFYRGLQGQLAAVRITRDLEIVEHRTFPHVIAQSFTIARDGEELIVAGGSGLMRLGLDLSVRETKPFTRWSATMVTESPRGVVLVTAAAPALTARYLDSAEGDVRVGSIADYFSAGQMVWTGSEFFAAWMHCSSYSSCTVRMARLDAELQPLGQLDSVSVYCHVCPEGAGVLALGDDEVLVTWQNEEITWARRFRKGAPLDAKPLKLGSQTVAVETIDGSLLAVDDRLRTGIVPPPGSAAELESAPTVEIATEQMLLSAGRSDREIAVAWRNRHPSQDAFAAVFDLEGQPLREVRLPKDVTTAAISSDGADLYALTSDYWYSYFQKLGGDGEPLQVNAQRGLFAWNGSGFLVVRPEAYDYEQEIEYPRALAVLDRAGRMRDACPQPAEVPEGLYAIRPGEGETLLVGPATLVRVRGGCAAAPEREPLITWEPKVVWHRGRWALLFNDAESRLHIALARGQGPFLPNPRPLFERYAIHSGAAIAGAGDYWIVLSKGAGTAQAALLHAALLDAEGNVLHRMVLDDDTLETPQLVPVSDTRVLAVYEQLHFQPPWLGEARVVVRPLDIEQATRRRVVRH